MGKLYGFGAAIVIIGALFKIQHYPGANIMLPVGLGMEAVIFFFSALQKPHVEPDWSLVHPQFIETYHTPKEVEDLKAAGKIPQDYDPNSPTVASTDGIGGGGGGGRSDQLLDSLLEKANIDDKTIDRFGKGMEKFAKQAESLGDISNASVATNNYVTSINKASEAARSMDESFGNVSSKLQENVEATSSYSENVKKVSSSAARLAEMYENTSKAIESQGSSYQQTSQKLVDNLSALNSVYELQLKETNKQKESTQQITESVDHFMKNLEASNNATASYQKQVEILSEKVSALNNVYGNMLSAMNVSSPNK
ncbi:MAG TPA: gliding motility protein GldL [Bacteroidales bacterium]|nr:gliding motility protein GldL [Bacteroidales bacterium]